MSTRRLTAVMFTDIVGYTAMMQADEASSMAKVSRFREVVARQVEAHQGKLIEIRGDGSLSIFSSATEAVACAKHIQESLREDIPLRIGIHSGDVVERDGQIFGDAVNIASRIESLGVPGAVLASSNIAKQIKNKADFDMTSLGKFHFKNVDEPMEIFALENEGFVVPKRSEVQGKLKQSAPSYLKWAIPIAVLVLVALFATQSFWGSKQVASKETTEEKTLSIAVLPFRDLSPNGDQEYFSDGVSEELLNVLTKVNKLEVASRTSSFVFKREDRNIQDIAEILEVDYVLEGSVRKSEKQLRITAQLIDAETDRHIWSETYDRKLDDIFALQDELAGAIVKEVNELVGNDPETPIKGLEITTENQSVYDLYLQAQSLPPGYNNGKMLALLEKALELDSTFVEAASMLAVAYWGNSTFTIAAKRDSFLSKASEMAQYTLRIDSTNLLAQTVTHVLLKENYQWEEAINGFEKLLQQNPSGSEFLLQQTALTYQALGYIDKSIPFFERDIQTKPNAPYPYIFSSYAYLVKGEYDKAKQNIIKGRVLNYAKQIHNQLIYIYSQTKQVEEITFILANDLEGTSYKPLIPQLVELILAETHEKEKAKQKLFTLAKELEYDIEALKNKFWVFLEEYDDSILSFNNSTLQLAYTWTPLFKPYRQTEYFKNYIREANVLAYWQKHGFPPQCRDLGNGDFECD